MTREELAGELQRRPLLVRAGELTAISLILTLAAWYRLARVADNPGWFADEGTHLLIARQLAQGRIQYMAISQSTLLFAKLPLFDGLLALLFRIVGTSIGTLRNLTGSLGILAVAILYIVARRTTGDRVLALLAAALLACYPQAVLYSRFGFSYNLLAPLLLAVYLFMWEYLRSNIESDLSRRRWLAAAALTVGVGTVSDLWMFSLVIPLAVVTISRHWRDVAWAIPLAFLPFGVYCVLMLVRSPESFCFDLAYTLSRLSGTSLTAQVQTLARNYSVLVSQGFWVPLAIIGFFVLPSSTLRNLSLLMFLVPLVSIGRTEAIFSLSAYYTIPVLPLVVLGVAGLLRAAVPFAVRALRGTIASIIRGLWQPSAPRALGFSRAIEWVVACAILGAIVGSPIAVANDQLVAQVRDGFITEIDPFLIDPLDGREAADFVDANTNPDDLVIGSPGLAWQLEANTADLQMPLAYQGVAGPHMPADVPQDRFVYEVDYHSARFVIVENLWYNWGIHHVPGLAQVLEDMSGWSLVYESGSVQVYCNPRRWDC
jgi:hypothetical protein